MLGLETIFGIVVGAVIILALGPEILRGPINYIRSKMLSTVTIKMERDANAFRGILDFWEANQGLVYEQQHTMSLQRNGSTILVPSPRNGWVKVTPDVWLQAITNDLGATEWQLGSSANARGRRAVRDWLQQYRYVPAVELQTMQACLPVVPTTTPLLPGGAGAGSGVAGVH